MTTLSDFAAAAQMRDLVTRIVMDTAQRLRPSYRYATVVSFDRTARKCEVQYAGEPGTVMVNMGGIQPLEAGQTVRIDGLVGDRYISDVMGPIYEASMDTLVNRGLMEEDMLGYTPTYTNWNNGTGGTGTTRFAQYMLLGGLCYIELFAKRGSTGASIGSPAQFTLPYAPKGFGVLTAAYSDDSGFGIPYAGGALFAAGQYEATLGGSAGYVNATYPFTWAVADHIRVTGVYNYDPDS